MKLDLFQRWLLSNQMEILAKLKPLEAHTYERAALVLQRGYELEYQLFARHLNPDVLSDDECMEVLQILSMFDAMRRAREQLGHLGGIEEWQVIFRGFDGNHETTLMAYAQHVCDPKGAPRRFESLGLGRVDFNSHSRMLSSYRRQLDVYRTVQNPAQLSEDEYRCIAAAAKASG